MMTCLIVDDQKEAIDLINDHIKMLPETLTVKYSTTNPIDALKFLDENKVDIIFLDIQMHDFSGLDFVQTLKEKLGDQIPHIVFTTGYDHYALSSYEHGVSDYLLKPITFKRFKISIDRIMKGHRTINTHESPSFFFADVDGEKLKINFNDILYIQGARNYISISTTDRKMITYMGLSSILEILPPDKFLRAHKSYIINIDKIHSIKGNEIQITVKNTLMPVPLGITFKENILKKLKITE